MTYQEQLQDERWFLHRDFVKSRDNHQCVICGDKNNLEVHHIRYINGLMAWEYPHYMLKTLCHCCHRRITEKRFDELPPWSWIIHPNG